MTVSTNMTQQLKRMKEQLLDLSFRSPFLNFKHREKRSVRIVKESPAELLRLLYEEQESMIMEIWEESLGMVPSASPFEVLDSQPLEEHHLDKSIQTSILSDDKLLSTLKSINLDANDALDEKGINLLHLGLGVLEYPVKMPTGEVKTYQAPLLLLPVQLQLKPQPKKGKPLWLLYASGDDPAINLTLCRKLALDFNLHFPVVFDESTSLYDGCLKWFRTISEAVKSHPGFMVTTDCYLGFFNFQKYALYKDMESFEELYLNHPLTKAILDPNQFHLKPESFFDFQAEGENSLDVMFPPESAYHVLDADFSQLIAIFKSQQGNHLIIEGPPGTGKSQTIANIIANALGCGKRVLFVCEKPAALQVVFDRLQRLGIGIHCLELHSTKTNRKAVMTELQVAFDAQLKSQSNPIEVLKRKLPELRNHLSQYVFNLHRPIEPMGITLYNAVGKFHQLAIYPRPIIRLPDIHLVTPETLEEQIEKLGHLERVLACIGNPTEHPWKQVQRSLFSAFEKEELKCQLEATLSLLNHIQTSSTDYAMQLGVKRPDCLGDIGTFCDVISTLLDSPSSEASILANEHWNHTPSSVTWLIQSGKQYESLHKQLEIVWTDDWLLQPESVFRELQDTFKIYQKQSIFRFLNLKYYKDMKLLLGFQHPNSPRLDIDSVLSSLERSIQFAELRKEMQQQDAKAKALFGFHWKGGDTNWKELEKFTQWITQFRQFALQDYFNEKGFEVASKGQLSFNEWQPRLTELTNTAQKLHQNLEEIVQNLTLLPNQTLSLLSTPLHNQSKQISLWIDQFPKIDEWTAYLDTKSACLVLPQINTYLSLPEVETDYASSLVKSFEALFYHQWTDKVISEQKHFQKFVVTQHQEQQQLFQQYDKEVTNATRLELLEKLQNIKNRAFANSDERQRTYLQTQIRKNRQGESIRSMFKKSSELILYLKPCLMMSPLSVAEFIDPTKTQFDMVIFDEASQVPPSESLAALIRAKQAIVVGDSKQLPPTNFFSKQIESSDLEPSEEDEESIIDNKIEESILDQCYKAGFTSCMLKWHYRSKHESLITFSNRKFYQDLYTFPSAENEMYGLKYHYVKGGIYEGEGRNTIEARAIVDEICLHAKHFPHLSLGVATFGIKQRIVILDLLEERKVHDPILTRFMESHPHERFFVKNLENVQGDERDIMIMSVTYGRNESGKFNMNFGPVNGDQGWRRLNVIATRARYAMKVFASFRADELDPTRLNNQGARYFQEFLNFAEKKRFSFESPTSDIAVFDSPFEESVFNALTARGYKCITQVGQSGYRIDIGILDSEIEGLFIAGVECDGAQYHSSLCARDRDRLRQSVLESLGWTIIRVWSTGWFKNPEAEMERLITEIEQARSKTHQRRNEKIEAELTQKSWEFEDESDQEITSKLISHIQFQSYERFIPQPFGQPNQLIINKTFFQIVNQILSVESPLHIDELTRLVIAHWNLSRVSDKSREMVLRALSAMIEMGEPIQLKAKFAYHTNVPIQPRNRKSLNPLPKFELISDEEIEVAIKAILESDTILPELQLAQKTANLLGYDRLSVQIKDRVQNLINSLVSQSSLVHASYGVQLLR